MTRTPLEEKLIRLIEANGPMSVADYVAHCLGDPAHGYYATRDPFGAAGDFITAPEVSQMFGEIVGAWLIETWQLIGSPSPVLLVELGPGRGTLAADILRVAKKVPTFFNAVSIHLVETSPMLKARQRETLAGFDTDIQWHASFAEVPNGPLLLVANEFFDALPIRQYVRTEDAWRERVIGVSDDGRLAFGLGAGSLPLATGERSAERSDGRVRGQVWSPPSPVAAACPRAGLRPNPGGDTLSPMGRGTVARDAPEAREGAVLEVCPAAGALVAGIARRIVEFGGAALVIDYGYEGPAFGDTLQAVRGHEYADPLATPGEADLTAHVDFSALARSAAAEGAEVHGPMTQGDFLVSLGLLERAGRLGANASDETREKLRLAVERLAGPGQMGTLFKAMAVARPGISLPGFHPGSMAQR